MREICEDIKENVHAVIAEWERLVREQPWYLLPAEHRVNNLPAVVLGLVEASLCRPVAEDAHWMNVTAAVEHGESRRAQGIPEHLMFTEYHLLRQAIWYYLERKFGSSDRVTSAIMRIDTAITLATNASMWGYFRAEIEAQGKWEEGVERIVRSSPFLAQG